MGETRTNRPRRRLGGLIIVVVVAVAAVALVLWVVLHDNDDELLAPPVNTTPQLGPDALAVQFNAAVAVTVAPEEAFLQGQATASAACACAAGEQDPQQFADAAQALLPPMQEQERQLTAMLPAAAADISDHLQALIDINKEIQADLDDLATHRDDDAALAKARLSLLDHLAVRTQAVQVVQNDLGIAPQGQPTG